MGVILPELRLPRTPRAGPGFRPRRRRLHFADRGAIAQLGERLDRTQEVAGSSPASSTSPIEIRPASQAMMISIGTTFRSLPERPTPAGPASAADVVMPRRF